MDTKMDISLPCFEELYRTDIALKNAMKGKTRNGMDVHAVFTWSLPKSAELCLLAIEASGLSVSEEVRAHLFNSASADDVSENEREKVLDHASKRKFYEDQLSCKPYLILNQISFQFDVRNQVSLQHTYLLPRF